MTRHRVGFYDDWEADGPVPSVGSASTVSRDGAAKRQREFPPGFHGANPGPSYEDEPAPRRPRRKKQETKNG